MTGNAQRTTVWLAVVGLVAAASSTYMHLQLVSDPGYTSFCDISETVSCTQLYQSRYGSYGGVPVALGGVFWFGVVLLFAWANAAGSSRTQQHVAAYMTLWATVGLSVAMYMAYASFIVLGTFCLLCGVVYAAVVGIFFLSGSAEATPLRGLPAALAQDVGQLVRHPTALTATVAFLATTGAAAVWFPEPQPLARLAETLAAAPSSPPSADQASEFERFWSEQPRADVGIDLDGGGAPVVVFKFNDYQCPACAQAHSAYEPIFAKYESIHPGGVRLIMVDFPLDPACNDDSPNGPHPSACEAAVSVRLAREVGDDFALRMERWLYSNQETMSAATIAQALSDIAAVSPEVFEARYDEVIEDVRADIAVGAALPVEATPTYVVNGVLIKGTLSPQFFDQAIAVELDRATATPTL